MASAGLASIKRTITVNWRERSQADAKALLVRTARNGHVRIMREQVARSGLLPEWRAWANTPSNSNIESVKLPGPIVYQYSYMREIVQATIKALEAASPVQSGDYKRGHGLWINALPVANDTPIKPGQEVFIANSVDYARRLEVGKTDAGRAFLIQVKNHIYERTAKKIAAQYGNVAHIYFGYVELPNAWVIKGKLGPTYMLPTGKKRKRRQAVGDRVRAPAIFIEHLPQ